MTSAFGWSILLLGNASCRFCRQFYSLSIRHGGDYGCPGHDQRDLDFARANQLPVIPVVLPAGADDKNYVVGDVAHTGDGTMFNSDFLNGLPSGKAKNVATDRLVAMNLAVAEVQYRLRDWAYQGNVIGVARYRLFTAPVAMMLPCRKRICR